MDKDNSTISVNITYLEFLNEIANPQSLLGLALWLEPELTINFHQASKWLQKQLFKIINKTLNQNGHDSFTSPVARSHKRPSGSGSPPGLAPGIFF